MARWTDEEISELAVALNRRLYSENPDVDWELASIVNQQIDVICTELGFEEQPTREWRTHRCRLTVTLGDLRTLLVKGMSVLELGEWSVASYLLRAHYPGVDWSTSDWDLRLPWPTTDDTWDVVVMTEVLEHLSDPPDGFNETFAFRGVDTCLQECFRSLRPGGRLFLTTPNAASVLCLHQVLNGETAWYYHRHIREYSGVELQRTLERAGFTVESQRAVHCLHVHDQVDFAPLFKILLEIGSPTKDRGDSWFVTAGKLAVGGSLSLTRDRSAGG